jgi:2-oxoglutarate/2-oxoacid ferredoxin oxidoreductase subunit beta
MKPQNLTTKQKITWCPGCGNFGILESAKRAISEVASKNKLSKKDFAFVTGIGCHAKIFDYLDLNGFYGLHGRVLPVMTGIKLASPKTKVIGFAGDGDTYAEGMEHFVHAFRHNANMTFIVHNNQVFSLTTGQATPTTQESYKNPSEPLGEMHEPLNPVKIALACGGTFIARCNSMDIKHTTEILKKAIEHKGFSYVEILQKCRIFNKDMNSLDKLMYKVEDNADYEKALKLVEEWNYNSANGKIPIGVLYKTNKKILEEK